MPSSSARLPPGQQLAAPAKWPIVGETAPADDPSPWVVTIDGCVESTRRWTLDELHSLPLVERTIDIHCVTRWSKLNVAFRGIPLATLLAECHPTADAEFVSFEARSARRHSTSLPLADATALDALVALAWNQRPLPVDHGGPVRMIVPGRYFYKSVKWLTRIELRSTDRLGYWESHAGYHNRADPWLEQRFLAPSFNRREAELLLQVRNVAGRELRGLDAAGRCLTDLVAREAVLRDTDFSRCDLRRADFSGANLSNARFLGADLRWAVFRAADVEGADYRGADLRGADFRGASLLGVSFAPHSDDDPVPEALLDATTLFSHSFTEQLTPLQAEWVRRMGTPARRAGE